MKHEPTCLIYLCTCEPKIKAMEELVSEIEVFLDANKKSFADFLYERAVESLFGQCPCGAYTNKGCSQTGCPLLEET